MNASRGSPLALGLLLVVGGCGPREAAVELVISISPQCTTCDDFVRCTPDAAATGLDAVVVYHLAPKSAAAQLATIFDYLTQLFRQKTSDRRPLIVYRPGAEADAVTSGDEAVLDLVAHRIEVPGAWIDQLSGQWFAPDGAALGHCAALPRAEGMALREALAAAGPR